VHIEVAILPDGWKDRLVSWDLQSSKPAEPLFWTHTTSRSQNLPRALRRTTTSSWRLFVVGCSMGLESVNGLPCLRRGPIHVSASASKRGWTAKPTIGPIVRR
jgi:hypothetical protein